MSVTDPEKVRLESRLWHYELAIKRLAQNCQDAESRRVLGELEAGLKKANEDADNTLDRAPVAFGSAPVLLVQEMDPVSREVAKPWAPVDGRTRIDEFDGEGGGRRAGEFRLSVITELQKLGRRSHLRGYSGLSSRPDDLVSDLLQGHVLTLDDGTSLQVVKMSLVAEVQQ